MRRFAIVLALAAGTLAGAASTWLLLRDAAAPSAPAERRVLYWYDPMVPDQHFERPGKSPFMDMALVPKYADDDAGADGVVAIDPRIVQNLGVRTARAGRGDLHATLHANAVVAFDESAVTQIQARVGGIVERLYVRTPLATVRRGEPMLSLVAPEWTAAQAEYLSLRDARSPGLAALRDAARVRLRLLGMSDSDIAAVERRGSAQERITIVAPRSGVVGELAVREGASVAAGTPLARVSGLDTVWVDAAIPEADVARLAPGAAVEIDLPALREPLSGSIGTLLPDVDATTRTRVARIVLANPGHRLVPGMFAQVRVATTAATDAVLVPSEAVIATGTRHVVIVDAGGGTFRAQEVRVGAEADGRTVVVDGIADGDVVVLSGQFLIDSEASLAGTLARLDGATRHDAEPTP